MDHSTYLHVLYGLDELVHDECYFAFFKLVGFYMFKQLSAVYLLHHYENMVIGFKGLTHLNYIWVGDQANYLVLFSQEVLLLVRKRAFVDKFYCHRFQSLFILTLPHGTKLAVPQLAALSVLIFKIEVVGLLLKARNPLKDDGFRLVIKLLALQVFVLTGEGKTVEVLSLQSRKVDEETPQKYYLGWNFLALRVIDEKRVVSQNEVPADQHGRLVSYFSKETLFDDN